MKTTLERFVVKVAHRAQCCPHYVEENSFETLCGLPIPPCPQELPIVNSKHKVKPKKVCKNCKRIALEKTKSGIVALARRKIKEVPLATEREKPLSKLFEKYYYPEY